MIRGFLSGAFWGTVVAALGLGTVSQLTPQPVARISAEASAVPRVKPEPAVKPAVAADPVVAPAPVVEAVPEVIAPAAPVVEAAPEQAAKPAPEPAPELAPELAPEPAPELAPELAPVADPAPIVKPTPDAPEVAAKPAAPAPLDPPAGSEFLQPLPDVAPAMPAADPVPAPEAAVLPLAPPVSDAASTADAPPAVPVSGPDAPAPLAPPAEADVAQTLPAVAPDTRTAAVQPDQLTLPQADTAPVAVEPPAAEEAEVLLKPLPELLPVPEVLPVPELLPAPEPPLQLDPDAPLIDPDAELAQKAPATLAPTPGLKSTVDGVTIGRLPRIGDVPAVAETETPPEAAPNADGSPALVLEGDADLPPLQKYARSFDNPDGKPLFAIILIDTGGADVDRAALASLPFAVSFALDPLAPGAAEAEAIYRAAGQEVIMVATGIPVGATASDLEVTFQAHATALPEAVAVIDTEFGAFQADRPLATQVVPILKAQGRGLISWDRGLNAADQVARREGLAAGLVFRKLDGKGENTAAVRRALDRAAFKAAQDGRVMVIGQTLPETVAALMEWAVEGRAASVALAPVSAVLTTE